MVFVIFWLLGLLVGIVTTIINKDIRSMALITGNLLFYQLVITVTLSNLLGFVGHVFKSDMIAESIGWEKGSPFQKELGFCEFGYAISGVLCIWFGKEFWLAIIVITSPLYLGAALIHVKEIIINKNLNVGNSVSILHDLLIPITLIVLWCLSHY